METNARITFDTNVLPSILFGNQTSEIRIRKATQEGLILSCIAETLFTLEAIKRKKRKQFLERYNPKIKIHEQELPDGTIKACIAIVPDTVRNLDNNKVLEICLEKARGLGFKILRCPRIAGIVNKGIKDEYYLKDELATIEQRQKVSAECLRKIEQRGCGCAHIMKIGKTYNSSSWFDGIKKAPGSINEQLAKAVAEWADGDSICAHVAYKNQYFCSKDFGKKSGSDSILSDQNRKWLTKEYGVKFVTPNELAVILNMPNST